MSTHITAKSGEISDAILLPGDPLRAKFIAETFLKDARQYTNVRNIFGYTGLYKGKPVSVQGTGMGIPSISIYVNELFREYGVKRAIRIGTAGAIQSEVEIRDVILATAASTDNGANNIRFRGRDFAPAASFPLLKTAYEIAVQKGFDPKVGTVVSSDMFYTEDSDDWKIWAKFGCLAIEMETAELYTLAAKYRRDALALLTISDHVVTGQITTAEERQNTFVNMIEIALDTAVS
ncbi:MAG: purine-nucleoside phosphorylase [Treponema sp.]|jgi:purine-nucleoside phosphorylase|nr:purine-nucleoside phosphorylase [Treponema sp.]